MSTQTWAHAISLTALLLRSQETLEFAGKAEAQLLQISRSLGLQVCNLLQASILLIRAAFREGTHDLAVAHPVGTKVLLLVVAKVDYLVVWEVVAIKLQHRRCDL